MLKVLCPNANSTCVDVSPYFVAAIPKFTVENSYHVYARTNSSVTLDCHAEGFPSPSTYWYRDGAQLLEGEKSLSFTLLVSYLLPILGTFNLLKIIQCVEMVLGFFLYNKYNYMYYSIDY